ncbi:MAG TPA: TetR/AcrR family transcriptional regulator [Amycolatopsis sp.]|nr:TetR/AcrR family transcriptional regulator [Amycolatopsis sp.]
MSAISGSVERLGTRAERSAERRNQITAVATQQIMERGFENLSVNDLAAAVGISVGGMYRYIATKTDLLVMVCQDIYGGLRDELGDLAAGPEPVEEKLPRAIDVYLRSCDAKGAQIAMMYREYRSLPPEAQQEYKQRELAIANIFVDLIRSGIRHRKFRPVDASVLATDIIFLGHMPSLKGWALRGTVGSDELRREQTALVMSRLLPESA